MKGIILEYVLFNIVLFIMIYLINIGIDEYGELVIINKIKFGETAILMAVSPKGKYKMEFGETATGMAVSPNLVFQKITSFGETARLYSQWYFSSHWTPPC